MFGIFSCICRLSCFLFHRLINHKCMDLFLNFLFCPIDLCLCFCASTIIFWFVLFSKIVFVVWGLLCFHTNLAIIICFGFMKNAIGIFERDCVESVDWLGSIVIITILILPTHKYGIYSQLFMSCSISLVNVSQHFEYRSCTFLIRFILKYIIFSSRCKWGCFLNFFCW